VPGSILRFADYVMCQHVCRSECALSICLCLFGHLFALTLLRQIPIRPLERRTIITLYLKILLIALIAVAEKPGAGCVRPSVMTRFTTYDTSEMLFRPFHYLNASSAAPPPAAPTWDTSNIREFVRGKWLTVMQFYIQ
jgi:hypothetical protein